MRFSTGPLPHSPRPLSPHQPSYPTTANAIPPVVGPLLAVVFTPSTITLQIAPERPKYPSGKNGPRRQIGSHVGNMGPFWKITVPLEVMDPTGGDPRVPLEVYGSHLRNAGPISEPL